MLRQMLKSKIHRAVITDGELNYEGSIACDPEWLRHARSDSHGNQYSSAAVR